MKILVVSLDELFGKAIALELGERGWDTRFSTAFEGGTRLLVVDADTIDTEKIKSVMITFSTADGKGDLTRPFLIESLLERIKEIESGGGKVVNHDRYEHLRFTEKERMLLDLLLENRGKVVGIDEIIKVVWNDEVSSNIVNVYIRYLREKLEGDGDKRVIFTVRGKGYKIE